MVQRMVQYCPGLYKIFDEIIVNAADNKVRDTSMDTIKINIDRENNTISVYNNGRGIPIRMHEKEQVYVPELIFGHLLTSSNYDDDEQKITGGRNGYGAKLCNIFSTMFTVETADSESGKKFKQVFTNNMSQKTEPKITANPRGEDFTRISFKPDLQKFNMETIDDDCLALLTKRVYDLAGCVRGVKVFLNDTRIKIRDFKDYVDLYLNKTNETTGSKPPIIYERINDRWEVAFTLSDGQFNQVSFVNSICTVKGGTHVNYIADQITAQLIEAVKKKDKKGIPLKPFQAKNHLWIFVNTAIVNPTFDSQTKETLTLRASSFGSKAPLGEEFMKKVLKSGVVENVLSFAKFKQDQLLKKTDGGKRSRISGLTKLDDANNAGTKNASQCTLILTEGDSAKSLAVSGLSVVGRDNFGVFPLRGKLLNVREASHQQIMANAEISAIKQILGLQQGKVYNDTSSLRYGHLMIMTDQDYDGSHIKGLIINFFDHFWPSLLKIPGFLLEFITPIVKATKGKGTNRREVSFFTIPEYESWKEENNDGHGWTFKYYKGLGTSTTEDAKKYFSNLEKHLKPFKASNDESRTLIDMAFNKKKADERKEWLRGYQPGTFMDHDVDEIPIPDFINKELILFSRADNIRSIPCSVDGFKPGQRKILFSCFKRNLKAEIKVAQLAGYVAEHSAYHHGEVSLCQTIVNMAQNFVGSNNLNLLEPLGQFGTRLQGGKDAASPRYIFTNLSSLARTIFHPKDDALLTYLNDDGQSIEPEWYIPVIPMLLVNGGEGIGTGWSTAIPNYNPRDIVQNLMRLMEGKEMEPIHPWYRGFEGTIEQESASKYKISGVVKKIDSTTIEITELPLRSWTQNYKEWLESCVTGTDKQPAWIKDYKEYHTDSKVHFVIHLTEENMKKAEKEGLEQRFKVSTTITTTNLVCHDLEGRIRKYGSVLDIIQDFYELRQTYYHKRKDHMLDELTQEHVKIDNRVRFVTEIIQGKLVVQNRKKQELLQELKERGYEPIYKKGINGEEDAEEIQGNGGYDYLLSMPIWNLTMEKVQQLINEKQQKEAEIQVLLKLSAVDLWKNDLEAFLNEWDQFSREMEEAEAQRPNNSTAAYGKKKTSKKTVDSMFKKKKLAAGSDIDSDDAFEVEKKKPVKKIVKKKLDEDADTSSELVAKKTASKKVEDISPPAAKKKAAPKKKAIVEKKPVQIDSDSGTESDLMLSDDEDEAPKVFKFNQKKMKKAIVDSDEDEPKPKKVTKPKRKSPMASDEDDVVAIIDSEEEKPKAKKPTKKKSTPQASDEEVFAFPSKEKKLKQTTLNFAKSTIPSKRSTPEKDEKPKKKALTTKKIAVPGIKAKPKKKDEHSDNDTAFDDEIPKPKASRAKKATVIKGLPDSEMEAPPKKNRFSIATEDSFVDDGADSYEFSE